MAWARVGIHSPPSLTNFQGSLSQPTLAQGAPRFPRGRVEPPPSSFSIQRDGAAARELWDIACGAAGKDFLVVLTPNWNAEHRNHLHLELTTHDWVLVR